MIIIDTLELINIYLLWKIQIWKIEKYEETELFGVISSRKRNTDKISTLWMKDRIYDDEFKTCFLIN